MPLQIIRDDITKVECDAIVNAANKWLRGGGGVDGAIHDAAGPGLHEECMALGGCKVGQAKITKGYALPCKYVIHTVGPRWHGGMLGEAEKLASCYRQSLKLAREYGCESVAFPLISAGVYGYPKDQALEIAVTETGRFLLENDMLVYIVVYDRKGPLLSKKLESDISEYIGLSYESGGAIAARRGDGYAAFRRDDKPIAADRKNAYRETAQKKPLFRPRGKEKDAYDLYSDLSANEAASIMPCSSPAISMDAMQTPEGLDDMLRTIDESFSQMLLRKIDEKGMSDSQCYKKANIDRKLFSKIRSDAGYRPSKSTALAFAVALELTLEETKELLMKAGFALSHSSKFDIIIEYFIKNGNYDIFMINEVLFAFDQSLLGGVKA